jgi:hypothetical protein
MYRRPRAKVPVVPTADHRPGESWALPAPSSVVVRASRTGGHHRPRHPSITENDCPGLKVAVPWSRIGASSG